MSRTADRPRRTTAPAVPRAPGPVTAAFRIASIPLPGPWALALRVWPLAPALALVRPALLGSQSLPVTAGRVLGLDATLCLAGCLAVTPLLTAARLRAAKLRWWYGVWMFGLGAAGLAIAVSAGPGGLEARAAGNATNWTGLATVVLLLPMVAMSNLAAQKVMGPEWKRWQRGLVWAVWAMVLVHLLLLRHPAVTAGFLMATVPLAVMRFRRVRQGVKDWRASRYESGRMWALMGACAMVVLIGVMLLIDAEILACARAVGA